MNFGSAPSLFSWLWQAFLRPHDGTPPAAQSAPTAGSALLPKLRQACERLIPLAERDKGAATAARALRRIEARLERPPRLALLGDFNSGKSSLAHLLLGGAMPSGGVIPETRAPVLFRYGEQPALYLVGTDGKRRAIASGAIAPAMNGVKVRFVEARLPLDLLRRVEIVDVPGTANPNTAAEAHALLPDILRNIHFALWCTPAPQAWKGNEQRAWHAMPPRLRAASLLVATQADRVRQQTDREKVLARLRRETAGYFRAVLMISARQRALTIEMSAQERERAKADGANMDLWYAHGGAALWQALNEAIAAVTATREAAAARVASRIAKRQAAAAKPVAAPIAAAAPKPAPAPAPTLMQQPQPQPSQGSSDLRDAILGLWSRRAEAISVRLAQKAAPNEAMFAEFAGELNRFAREALLPRLEAYLPRAQADDTAALFLCDAATLVRAAEGLSADATAKLLGGVLTQLAEELAEALDGVTVRPPVIVRAGAGPKAAAAPIAVPAAPPAEPPASAPRAATADIRQALEPLLNLA